jgi:hypothetical protein
MIKNDFLPKINKSLNLYVNDNRSSSISSYIINVMRSERNMVYANELKLSKALSDCKVKLDKDEKVFEGLVEKENKNSLVMEFKLVDFQSANKDLVTQKKKLNYDFKQIIDDLERTVKNINRLKGNASFVLTVLDYPIPFKKKNFFDIETYEDIAIGLPKPSKHIDIQVEDLMY